MSLIYGRELDKRIFEEVFGLEPVSLSDTNGNPLEIPYYSSTADALLVLQKLTDLGFDFVIRNEGRAFVVQFSEVVSGQEFRKGGARGDELFQVICWAALEAIKTP